MRDTHFISPEVSEQDTFTRLPRAGLNSGVMLMRMDRMRQVEWSDQMWPIYTQYKHNLTWGDQDVLNVIFSQHRGWTDFSNVNKMQF
jgi:UDP-xylose:glucoside alpha-1,3-xylosyltransferase